MSHPGAPEGPADQGPQRWAPFPVQDWSTMPDPEPYAYVDPGWAPPEATRPSGPGIDRRPAWIPLIAMIVVTVLVAGGLVAAERIGAASGDTPALELVAPDGAAAYRQRETSSGNETVTSRIVEESARQTGAVVLGGVDFNLGSQILGVVGGDGLERMRFWRTTGTELNDPGNSQQRVRVYRVDGAVELVADSGRDRSEVYRPALVELPAQVADGATWSGEGIVGSRRYRSEFRASSAQPGCLQVDGTIIETTSTGQPGSAREVKKTWCRGEGIVAEQEVRGRTTTRVSTVAQPTTDPTLRTADEEWTWSDPANWRRRDFDTISTDPSFGTGQMTGATGAVPPVLAASGLIIRPTSGDDLVATTPKTINQWTSLWRMHPGGTILTLAAFGDVVVTTTSRREVVAYSDAGVRLWTLLLDEVAFWSPVRVDARRIAVADAGGTVRVVDLLTGEQAWQRRVGAQVSGSLVSGAGVVVVFDAGGVTTTLEAETGEPRWSVDQSATRGAILGGVLVVRSGGTLEGLELSTGRRRWLLPQTGTLDALRTFGDTVVAASQLGTLVIAEDGTVRQRLPAYEWVLVVGDTMVGWGRTQAEFRGADQKLLATIDSPDLSLVSSMVPPLAYRQGVVFFGRNWTFSTWSDEP